MRIAALQMLARAGDVPANLAIIAHAAAAAKARGADLLVAPELATTGYGAGDAILQLAESADGEQVAQLAQIAVKTGLAVVAGFAERAGGRVYNAVALVTPAGARIVYRKSHLYGPYERSLFAPGEVPSPVVEVGGVRLGILICYDVEFPEAVRGLAAAGAQLVVVPTALPDSGHAAFIAERIVPVRAFENGIAVVYANHAGSDGRFTYAGRSGIALPDGTDAARAPASGAALIFADYHPAAFAECRAANPYLTDRRAAFG
jgi:predicted amidohydrolase